MTRANWPIRMAVYLPELDSRQKQIGAYADASCFIWHPFCFDFEMRIWNAWEDQLKQPFVIYCRKETGRPHYRDSSIKPM